MKKGTKINISEKAINSFDMIKRVVKLISVSKGLILSETEIFALTHFVVNGFNKVTKDELVDNKLFKSPNSVSNLVHKFKKYGILEKDIYGTCIAKDFKIDASVDGIIFEFKIVK